MGEGNDAGNRSLTTGLQGPVATLRPGTQGTQRPGPNPGTTLQAFSLSPHSTPLDFGKYQGSSHQVQEPRVVMICRATQASTGKARGTTQPSPRSTSPPSSFLPAASMRTSALEGAEGHGRERAEVTVGSVGKSADPQDAQGSAPPWEFGTNCWLCFPCYPHTCHQPGEVKVIFLATHRLW